MQNYATYLLGLGPLRLIGWSGGGLKGRIRLQKVAYILKHLGVQPFASARFVYHSYGPYSRELSDALHQLIVSGLVAERPHGLEEGLEQYTYELTQEGRGTLQLVEEEPRSAELARRLLQLPWRVLELLATALYLQRDEEISSYGQALDRALELKPDYADFQPEVRLLLQDIDSIP